MGAVCLAWVFVAAEVTREGKFAHVGFQNFEAW